MERDELFEKLDELEKNLIEDIGKSMEKNFAKISSSDASDIEKKVTSSVFNRIDDFFRNTKSHITSSTSSKNPTTKDSSFKLGSKGAFNGSENVFKDILNSVEKIYKEIQEQKKPRDVKVSENKTARFVQYGPDTMRGKYLEKRVLSGTATKSEEKEYRKIRRGTEERKGLVEGKNKTGLKLEKLNGTLEGVAPKMITGAVGKLAGAITKGAGPIGMAFSAIIAIGKRMYKAYAEIDKAATDYAREVGGSAVSRFDYRKRLNRFIGARADWQNGFNLKETSEALREYGKALGRDITRVTNDSYASLVMLKRFGISTDTAAQMQQFGKSLKETDVFFTSLYARASKSGLSASTVAKAVTSNLRIAQNYTFQNGIKGLERMAETSTRLKYDMQMASAFADKVSTVEGALTTSASLSVLGGNFAAFGTPMEMLYESLNDIEALNNRMVSMFSGAARWNQKTGQIEIDAYERMRMREAAKAAGLDYSQLTSMVMNQEREAIVERSLRKTGFGRGLMEKGEYDQVSQYIKNLAEIDEKGRAFVSNKEGGRVNIEDLKASDIEYLKKESEARGRAEKGRLQDVYKSTMDIGERLRNIETYMNQKLDFYLRSIWLGGQWGGDRDLKAAWQLAVKDNPWEKEGISKDEYKRAVQRREIELDSKYFEQIAEERQKRKRYQSVSPEHEGRFSAQGYINENGIIQGRRHIDGGIRLNVEDGEAILPRSSVQKYGIDMIDQIRQGTYSEVLRAANRAYPSVKVLPVATAQNVGATNTEHNVNISSNPMQIDVRTNLNDLNIRFEDFFDTNRFAEEIYKRIYTKLNKGFDKENYPFA